MNNTRARACGVRENNGYYVKTIKRFLPQRNSKFALYDRFVVLLLLLLLFYVQRTYCAHAPARRICTYPPLPFMMFDRPEVILIYSVSLRNAFVRVEIVRDSVPCFVKSFHNRRSRAAYCCVVVVVVAVVIIIIIILLLSS